MKTANLVVDTCLRILMAASVLTIFVVTFMQVIFRFVLQLPLAWSQDIIRLGFVYLIYCGGAWCVKEKVNLNIDIVMLFVGTKTRKIMELFINLAILVFFGFILYYSVIFVRAGAAQGSPNLAIPMSVYYSSITLSASLILFYLLQQIFGQIRDLINPESGSEVK